MSVNHVFVMQMLVVVLVLVCVANYVLFVLYQWLCLIVIKHPVFVLCRKGGGGAGNMSDAAFLLNLIVEVLVEVLEQN